MANEEVPEGCWPGHPDSIGGEAGDSVVGAQRILLRDWFAGLAMQGTLAARGWGDDDVAADAYEIADAMLAARDEK